MFKKLLATLLIFTMLATPFNVLASTETEENITQRLYLKDEKIHLMLHPDAYTEEPQEETIEIVSLREILKRAKKCGDNYELLKYLEKQYSAISMRYDEAQTIYNQHQPYAPLKLKYEEIYTYLKAADQIIKDFILQTDLYMSLVPPKDKEENPFETPRDFKREMDNLVANTSIVDLSVDCFYGFHDLDEHRKELVNTALSLRGKITYEWGAKPKSAGWNARWNKEGAGMDCSGFVEWVYWTVNGTNNIELRSTLMISSKQKEISYQELKPGDLGMKANTGTYYLDYEGKKYYSKSKALKANEKNGYGEDEVTTVYNHVGIYVGKDINGRDIWCHCQGGDIKTVTVGTFEEFKFFYKMPDAK